MPEFKVNQEVVRNEPFVTVEVGPNNPLPVGRLRFQLVVVDDAGLESAPAFLEVKVNDIFNPTAILKLVNADGKVIDPAEVKFGSSFRLSGADSTDIAPGKIVQWKFKLLDRS